jgi:hypothetical protein
MKRWAAHYIYLFPQKILRMNYVELNQCNVISDLAPLIHEIESTVFVNGIILVFPVDTFSSENALKEQIIEKHQHFSSLSVWELLEQLNQSAIHTGQPVQLFQLDGIDLLTAKFRTDDGGCDCYVQRLA